MLIAAIFSFCLTASVQAATNWTQTSHGITLSNDRLSFTIVASNNTVQDLTLDGISLLGSFGLPDVTARAQTGASNTEQIGSVFFDGYAVPNRVTTGLAPNPNGANGRKVYIGLGGTDGNATYQVHYGVDKTNTSWVGAVMNYEYLPSNQTFNQYWFLRDGETGYHQFVRAAFHNSLGNHTYIDLGNLQELRTLISPNTNIWTHLITNPTQYSQHPSAAAVQNQTVAQDATWYFNISSDPYVKEQSSYFTKYSWTDPYRKHKAHGFYADGSQSNGSTLGIWTVFNNLENYLGGPIRTDLLVDTNIYNYYSSNHFGASTPNITSGFDRLFGPTYIYANAGGNLTDLLSDAETYASPTFASDFYDSIAPLVPGFAPAYMRGNVSFNITLPAGASNAVAILSENGADHQDNMAYNASQYWAELGSSGIGALSRVKGGVYRLTVYADGIFGDYVQDNVSIFAGTTNNITITWTAASHGTEIFRIGIPDKTAGEFKHGFELDPLHSNHPEEYRAYWGQYDFVNDFPNGVNFTIGESIEKDDFNYIHYSAFGGSFTRPGYVTINVNPWLVNFNLNSSHLTGKTNATFTVQLASMRSSSGNTDVASASHANITWTLIVNQSNNVTWEIPFWHSSSSASRSGISGYVTAEKLCFSSSWLKAGWNTLAFMLPFNVTSSAVQYDALRLELS